MKTYVLTGAALDWAVAKAEGEEAELNQGEIVTWKYVNGREYRLVWKPTTNWTQGGTIIEREGIDLQCQNTDLWAADLGLEASVYGTTPLIAAMRCYVASKLGDEIEVPEDVCAQ